MAAAYIEISGSAVALAVGGDSLDGWLQAVTKRASVRWKIILFMSAPALDVIGMILVIGQLQDGKVRANKKPRGVSGGANFLSLFSREVTANSATGYRVFYYYWIWILLFL
jgi:hypothetical protein